LAPNFKTDIIGTFNVLFDNACWFSSINVIARPNMPYIIHFGPYRPHCFVSGDASPLLSLTPQNMYDKLATSTFNKASYHSLTRRCWILQCTTLKEPDDPIGTTRQLVRSALIPNVTARPNLPYIVRFRPYRPYGFIPSDASPLLSLTSQNVYNKLTISTLNKTSYHSLIRRCGILQLITCFTCVFGKPLVKFVLIIRNTPLGRGKGYRIINTQNKQKNMFILSFCWNDIMNFLIGRFMAWL